MILGDIFRRNAAFWPHKTAYVFEDQRVTHAQYLARAHRLSNALQSRGLLAQDRIAIMSRNCAEYLDVYAAAELSGFIVATVNFRLAAPEVKYILDDCRPSVLFFEDDLAPVIERLRPELPETLVLVSLGPRSIEWAISYDRFLEGASSEPGPLTAHPDHIAYLIYTSGTTGVPKGVMLDHRGQMEQARVVSATDAVSPHDKLLLTMPLFHSGAKINQMGHAICGATIVMHRNFSPKTALEAIAKEKVTVAHLAPVMVQMILDSPDVATTDVSTLRTVHYSSAPMSVELLKRALKTFGPIFIQFYGCTENGLGSALHKEQHRFGDDPTALRRLASAGHAHFGSQIRVMKGQSVCDVGEPGEVWIRSKSSMRGYWNNTAATIENLQDGWVRSGDVGFLDDEQYLFIIDRQKDMIVSGGENIYSREVEEALQTHPAVAEAAVIGVPDAQWGEAVKAVVVLRPASRCNASELIEHCRAQIASYKKPRSIDFVAELPRLTNGKVDKKKIRLPYWASHQRMVS